MRTIEIKVIAGAKKNAVRCENGCYKIYLTAPAVDGKANRALVEELSEHFCVRKNQINIIKGLKTRHKTIRINDA